MRTNPHGDRIRDIDPPAGTCRECGQTDDCGCVYDPEGDAFNEHTPEVGAYWKEKEGKCLACNAEIALEDSYCPACTAFLMEVHQ